MEKYSAYRDPGTGIQPFLTAASPQSSLLATILSPVRYIVGLIRLAIILLLAIFYVLFGIVFTIIPPARRVATSAIIRAVLFSLGFFWIPTEIVSKKRGQVIEAWNPGSGDLIISNWNSWVELLWLAYRFDPIFVLPVPESAVQPATSTPSSPISHAPGRRIGRTSMPDASASAKKPISQVPITGFHQVSLLTMLRETGRIRKTSNRPIVVFPECTTSNGRGLLRFADFFQESLPVKEFNVFIMCVRYDPPTGIFAHNNTLYPSSSLNPLPHVFTLASSLAIPALTIRLLTQSESPSSPAFIVSEVIGPSSRGELAEASAVLISQLGKFKRMTMGWEDKARFLDFYGSKRRK
ncbi:hypothetical protein BT96DRAFT_952998 [Gymnopus androsaceus JB14]|uniref:Phospholipid/glycerol acyltransferase domain-containing protein n=1 Tax=Gymnopus androsaceus JB14 TaxID=1447944 RepID=A0A6A4IQE6_9AGAR|nr:hypothetical protein BT96DRAFT_952998 [Gymnopus androsaceus JB14]